MVSKYFLGKKRDNIEVNVENTGGEFHLGPWRKMKTVYILRTGTHPARSRTVQVTTMDTQQTNTSTIIISLAWCCVSVTSYFREKAFFSSWFAGEISCWNQSIYFWRTEKFPGIGKSIPPCRMQGDFLRNGWKRLHWAVSWSIIKNRSRSSAEDPVSEIRL